MTEQRKISPQIRYAVERALERARGTMKIIEATQALHGGPTLQGVAWADEIESLEAAVDVLKGLE